MSVIAGSNPAAAFELQVKSDMCIDVGTDRIDPRQALPDGCQLMGLASSCPEPLLWRVCRWQKAARRRLAVRTRVRRLLLHVGRSFRPKVESAEPIATTPDPT